MERRKLITLAACVAGAVFFFACAGVAGEKKVIEEEYENKWRIEVDYNEDGRFRAFNGYSNAKIYADRPGQYRILLGTIENRGYNEQYVFLRFKGEWLHIGVIELKDGRREAYRYFPKRGKGEHIATYYEKEPINPKYPDNYRHPGYTWIARCYYFKEGNYDHNLIPQAFFLTYRDSENIWGPEY